MPLSLHPIRARFSPTWALTHRPAKHLLVTLTSVDLSTLTPRDGGAIPSLARPFHFNINKHPKAAAYTSLNTVPWLLAPAQLLPLSSVTLAPVSPLQPSLWGCDSVRSPLAKLSLFCYFITEGAFLSLLQGMIMSLGPPAAH